MAGRRVFFSFHYQRDIWRANVVRNSGIVDAQAAAGWSDSSLWERAKTQGDAAVMRLIETGLSGTSVTVVLIGAQTSTRRWVNYEIQRSISRGNGLLGIHINTILDQRGMFDWQGAVPQGLINFPCYTWDRKLFGRWVEQAAVRAQHPCLAHSRQRCFLCM